MAISPELAIQTVIASVVDAKFPTVRTGAQPPHDGALPYIQFGQSTTSPLPEAFEIETEIHVWSSKNGPHEAKQMQHDIREQLNISNHLSNGWQLTCVTETYATVILDADEKTWHGVQRYRVIASLA